jgi:curved DNA-binding protein CbpA
VFCARRLLGLPAVEVDALGRPSWQCTDSDISRAYRKLAVLVHPDKTSHLAHPRSSEAFDCLNAAHRILKDPGKRCDEMSKQLERARKRRSLSEASLTGSKRVALNAERTAEVCARTLVM